MTIKVAILDLVGTLIEHRSTKPVDGVQEMIDELRDSNVRTFVASYDPNTATLYRRSGLQADGLISRSQVKQPKGSRRWVEYVISVTGAEPNEIVYLGDTDRDMREAVNSRLIYFNAAWSSPGFQYGIQATSPRYFSLIVREFFQKNALWYWQLRTDDRLKRPVDVRALMDGNGAGIDTLRNLIYSVFKRGNRHNIGPMSVHDFIALHLIGSIYSDGLYKDADIWTIYPRSSKMRSVQLNQFTTAVARLFRDSYLPDLLLRHTDAVSMHEERVAKREVDFGIQMNSVVVNDSYRGKVLGSDIVVIDDFTTDGYSAECARNLLLEAGAKKVTSVNIGKYGKRQHVIAPDKLYHWSPFSPMTYDSEMFWEVSHRGQESGDALSKISTSYQRVLRANLPL